MAEILPMPDPTSNATAGKKFLPSVSTQGLGILGHNMNWVSIAVVVLVIVLVWKFVLKK